MSVFKRRKTPGAESQRRELGEAAAAEEDAEAVPSSAKVKVKMSAPMGGLSVSSVAPPSSSSSSSKDQQDASVEKKPNLAVLSVTEEEEALAEKPNKRGKFGPSSAPRFVRATTMTDYNPELCKDYNQTGYCGFGDSCIYIHDRTTYVSGNVLDQRWDAELRGKKAKPATTTATATATTTGCGICHKSEVNVKTRCGHEFCETCAFERFGAGKTTCAVCSTPTLGIFNRT